METDVELRIRGLNILFKELGDVEMERFIALLLREPFDYTKWQRQLFPDASLEELSNNAMKDVGK